MEPKSKRPQLVPYVGFDRQVLCKVQASSCMPMSITLLSESSACSFEPTGTATVTMTPLNGSWHNPSLPNQCQGHGHCHGHWHAGPVAGPSPVSLRGWPLQVAACSKGTRGRGGVHAQTPGPREPQQSRSDSGEPALCGQCARQPVRALALAVENLSELQAAARLGVNLYPHWPGGDSDHA